ncbi:uncharacterized protein TNCV_1677461 [Trichonephila clavipes]|nr:uncharacterized protein TNCV_1677461 [Trichonephila clavipes]
MFIWYHCNNANVQVGNPDFPCIVRAELVTMCYLSYHIANTVDVILVTDLNLGEDMDVCKCIVPLWHGGTLKSRRAASPLMWLVEGEERWEAPGHPQGFLSLNWGGTEQNRTFTCMMLKAKA